MEMMIKKQKTKKWGKKGKKNPYSKKGELTYVNV